jgi:WD40 repeat protein
MMPERLDTRVSKGVGVGRYNGGIVRAGDGPVLMYGTLRSVRIPGGGVLVRIVYLITKPFERRLSGSCYLWVRCCSRVLAALFFYPPFYGKLHFAFLKQLSIPSEEIRNMKKLRPGLAHTKTIIIVLLGLFWFATLVQANPASQDDADLSGITVDSVAWSPDGSRIAVGKGRGICGADFDDPRFAILILDTNGQLVNNLLGSLCTATALAWSPDGTTLVSTDNGANIWFWNATTGAFLAQDSISFMGSPSLIWTPDSKKVYGIADGSIFVYDAVNKSALADDFADYKTKGITSITLSPDGSKLASGDQDGVIRILDTSTRLALLTFAAQSAIPTSLDWSPAAVGSRIASGYSDGTVKIWDASNGTQLLQLTGHTDYIRVVAWSPTGDRLATASLDGTVRIWNADTGTQLGLFQYPGKVLALDWSPDGNQIVYGGLRSDHQDTQAQIVPAPTACTATLAAGDVSGLFSANNSSGADTL